MTHSRAQAAVATPDVSPAPRYLAAMILITGLFLMWGIANSLNDVLIAQFKKAFRLTDFQSGLVQSAFYVGYFAFAIPASIFMQRFGYRAAVVLGLLLYACGAFLFFPAAELRAYEFFLGALFIIASGLAFLETSANPLITVMGPPETADRRLNFAQAFNPFGAIAGVLFGSKLIFSDVHYSDAQLAALSAEQLEHFSRTEAAAVQLPYLLLGTVVLTWAVLVLLARFPPVAQRVSGAASAAGGFAALKNHPRYWFGVIAQFFYVGAQVGVWSYLIRYTQHNLPGTTETDASNYLLTTLALFVAGRFFGTYLMRSISAPRLMAAFAAANIALCLVSLGGGRTGLWALIGTGFFMSIMFPTIFSVSLRGLGEATKAGASFLVMAIVGGALLTPVMGAISDAASINFALIVPAVCFAVVLAFAMTVPRAAPAVPVR